MRKRTIRNGLRMVMVALILIVFVSYFHLQFSDLFSLSPVSESRIYRYGIFLAAAAGSYGVVMAAFGLALSPLKNDAHVRIMPIFFGISAMIVLFFYLLSSSIDAPARDDKRRLPPGETITI